MVEDEDFGPAEDEVCGVCLRDVGLVGGFNVGGGDVWVCAECSPLVDRLLGHRQE